MAHQDLKNLFTCEAVCEFLCLLLGFMILVQKMDFRFFLTIPHHTTLPQNIKKIKKCYLGETEVTIYLINHRLANLEQFSMLIVHDFIGDFKK